MDVYEIDPLIDTRWDGFLQQHPQASIFHTREWLRALSRTYGYQPIALTTTPPEQPLANGIPFCKISSWIGKRRLVSLPFSDHCSPLVRSPQELSGLLAYLRDKLDREGWDRIQVRAGEAVAADGRGLERPSRMVLHQLDLQDSLEEIFSGFHPSCVQRKIKCAVRESLACQQGTSDALLMAFYHLLLVTRRRHGLPPQPAQWFHNLVQCLGDKILFRVAYKDALPVAAICTLQYKQTLVYKYGCSDRNFSHLGGMQLLLWQAIQQAKSAGLTVLDLGRSECDNPGLIAFKDRWGAERTNLQYLQYTSRQSEDASAGLPSRIGKYLFSHAPNSVLIAAGRILYKHIG